MLRNTVVGGHIPQVGNLNTRYVVNGYSHVDKIFKLDFFCVMSEPMNRFTFKSSSFFCWQDAVFPKSIIASKCYLRKLFAKLAEL